MTTEYQQRLLDQQPIRPVENYWSIARQVDVAMKVAHRIAKRGRCDCDLDDPCGPHQRVTDIVKRYLRYCDGIVKTCACGKRFSRRTWAKLGFVGVRVDTIEHLELRNCTCRSTIARATWRAKCCDCGAPADDELGTDPLCDGCSASREHGGDTRHLADCGDYSEAN